MSDRSGYTGDLPAAGLIDCLQHPRLLHRLWDAFCRSEPFIVLAFLAAFAIAAIVSHL
jgi:hypothetical protein